MTSVVILYAMGDCRLVLKETIFVYLFISCYFNHSPPTVCAREFKPQNHVESTTSWQNVPSEASCPFSSMSSIRWVRLSSIALDGSTPKPKPPRPPLGWPRLGGRRPPGPQLVPGPGVAKVLGGTWAAVLPAG